MKFLTRMHSARFAALSGAICIAGFAGSAAAGDVAAGETKAATCITCHGAGGNVPIADYPKLAGQSRKYLLQVMREYADGTRVNPVMNAQMKTGMSDQDLQDLAAYFAAQSGDLR
ncbi:MAG: c-type cytochrome [Gammaproteobacteria bacterium]